MKIMKNIALILTLLIATSIFANETRIALVIGNAKYDSMGKLTYSTNDATDMAQTLSDLGFEVIKGIDLSKSEMSKIIRKFDKKLHNGDKDNTIGLFYYAGHGLEVEGKNYLIPIDAQMQFQEDASDEGIPLNRVLNNLSYAGNRMNIVILDACRNNPLRKRNRNIASGGWSAPTDATGMFIAYGTAPGRTAVDAGSNGRNGLYTQHILANIKKPGKTLEQVFKAVRSGVLKDSNKKQKTGQYNETTGADFYFVPLQKNLINSQNNILPIITNNDAQLDIDNEAGIYPEIIPIKTIGPDYPKKAAVKKLSGWVTIEFTITEQGSVVNPVVIESQPERIFDREAIKAILHYKFKPFVYKSKIPMKAIQTIEFVFQDNEGEKDEKLKKELLDSLFGSQ